MGKYSYSIFGLLLFIVLTTPHQSFGQYALDGLDMGTEVAPWHDKALGLDKAGILLGEYQEIRRISRNTHQFFTEDQWHPNSIRYRGEVYDSIYMAYNLETDVLLIRHPTDYRYHSNAIKPIQQDIDWFRLEGHTFRRYDDAVLNQPDGFFDELYTGSKMDMLAKRVKVSHTETTIEFERSDKYFYRYGQQYYHLLRKGSVTRVLSPYKKEIRSFIKANNLKVNTKNERDLVELIRFCDQLTSKSTQ